MLPAFLSLSRPILASSHSWFPPNYKRTLTTSDCSGVVNGITANNPKWTTAYSTSPVDKFLSYHLHLAWAGGNTAQSAAAATFLSLVKSTAGADASMASESDTNDLFAYSQTIEDYSAQQKQDPFYSQDMFIFMGSSYFALGTSFAMRYRSADLAATYDVDAFVHPNSECANFRPHGSGYLLAAAGVLGAFAVPMLPLALESAAESFYPATEDVSSGLLTIAGKAFGVVALFCLQPL